MAASYPSATKSFSTKTDGPTSTIFASYINDLQDEVIAIENALRVGITHNLLPTTTATYDIGISGTAWRDLFLSRDMTAGRNVIGGASGGLGWTGRASLQSPADSQIVLTDNAGTTFSRMMFGGQSASFPALRRSSAILETILADASAYAQHNALFLGIVDPVAAPSATAGFAKIYVDVADGDLKVIFGDGTIKTIVVDT